MIKKTKLEEKTISAILENYNIGEIKEFSLIKKGCVHSNYILETSKGKFILRVYEERTDEQIKLEIKLLNELKKIEIPIPNVILTLDKKYILNYNNYRIAIFTFLEGEHIKDSDATLNQIENIGIYMGRFHKSLEGFKPKEIFSKYNYNKDFITKLLLDIKKDFSDFPILYENYVLEILNKLNIPKLPQGLNHGDLHGENVLFIGNQVSGVLDFDDCFYGNILSDVGSGIAFWCIDNEIDYNKCKTFINAYETERKLSTLEKEYLFEQTQLFMLIHLLYWLWDKKNWKENIMPFRVLNNFKKIKKEDFIKNIF